MTTTTGLLTKKQEVWLLAGLLLLAFGLRIVSLDNAPPGLRYDELQNYLMAGRVVAGERPLYFAESWGHEPLYHYLQAGFLWLVGESDWSLRLPSVFLGMVELAATWLVAKELLGRQVGLMATAFLSFSFWAIFYSRVGLRVGAVTAFASLMVYFLWRCWKRPSTQFWPGLGEGVLSGIFLAAGVYTYLAGRVLPAIFVGFVLFAAVFHWRQFKTRWPRFALGAVVAGLLCWPLAQAIAANPTGEQRLELLNQAVVALRQGDPLPVLDLTVRALGMYVIQGEQDWLYNEYGRPIFGVLLALFFLIGLGWAMWRWRQPRYALLLLWFLGGTGPSMIAPPAASVTHSIVAQPAAMILLGVGVVLAWRWLASRQRQVAAALIPLLLITTGVEAWSAYFVGWNRQPEVAELYQGGITAVADAVQSDAPEGVLLLGGPYINYWQPWNAVNFDLAMAEDTSDVRWFNPAGAWVWPAAPAATYYFPKAPLAPQQYDPELRALFEADATSLSLPDAAYEEYSIQAAPVFAQTLSEAEANTRLAWPSEFVHLATAALPVNFDDRLQLLAVSAPEETAVETVRFMTYWQVSAAAPEPLIAFVHLLGDDEAIWGQQDWLDVRMAGLQPGDRFVQVHNVPIDPNAPAGEYRLQLGVYRPDTLVRLPLRVDGDAVADRILVGAIALER